MAPSRRRISVERRAAGPFDVPERVAVLRELVGQPVPHRADLEHHDADRVRDDVVQLACDPRALLGDRDAGGRLAFAFGLVRPRLGGFGLRGSLAQREADEPADANRIGVKTSSPAEWFGSL